MSIRNFKDITQKDADEVVQLIKSITGAEAVALIISEHKIPCEFNKEFGSCDGRHLTHFASDGVDPLNLPDLLEETIKVLNKNNIK